MRELSVEQEKLLTYVEQEIAAGRRPERVTVDEQPMSVSGFLGSVRGADRDRVDGILAQLAAPAIDPTKPWISAHAISYRSGPGLLREVSYALKHGGAIAGKVAIPGGAVSLRNALEHCRMDRSAARDDIATLLGLEGGTIAECARVVLAELQRLGLLAPVGVAEAAAAERDREQSLIRDMATAERGRLDAVAREKREAREAAQRLLAS